MNKPRLVTWVEKVGNSEAKIIMMQYVELKMTDYATFCKGHGEKIFNQSESMTEAATELMRGFIDYHWDDFMDFASNHFHSKP